MTVVHVSVLPCFSVVTFIASLLLYLSVPPFALAPSKCV